MNNFVNKIQIIEQESAAIYGGYWVFALFMPKDRAYGWDLVVSAPWLKEFERASIELITTMLLRHLEQKEQWELSKIVALNRSNTLVQKLLPLNISHDFKKIEDFENEDGQLASVIVITAQPHPSSPINIQKENIHDSASKIAS
jgi:hypothetical protein